MKSKSRFTTRMAATRRSGGNLLAEGTLAAVLAFACIGTSHGLVWTGPGGLSTSPTSGDWDTTTPNLWTPTAGEGTSPWAAGPADFGGATGPVTVTLTTNIPNVTTLNFLSTGYTLAATGGVRDLTLSGAVNVASGATAVIDSNVRVQKTAGSLAIGTVGTAGGTITISSGGTVQTTAGGSGTATYLVGNGTTINVNGTLARTANTNSASGSNDDTTHIANNAADNVTVNINTGGTYSSGGRSFRIGSSGNATMNVNGGTFAMLSNATQGHVYIGFGAGTTAATVNGGSFSTNPGNPGAGTGQLIVGLNANSVASLNVTDGTVNAYGRMVLGQSSTNAATVTLSGTGAIVVGNTGITMAEANAGAGTFNLNGGTLTTAAVIKGAGSGAATFNFNGGTIRANKTNAVFMSGLTTANVHDGGALFNTNGFDVTVDQALTHSVLPAAAAIDGGLTKSGAGTLTLSNTNSYTGPTTVAEGTLAPGLQDSLGTGAISITGGTLLLTNNSLTANTGISVGAAGTLKVQGEVANTLPLSSSGSISLVDGSPNTFTTSGIGLSGSTLNFDLLATVADRITVTGTANVAGTNTVNLSLVPGETLLSGNRTLLSSTGGLNAANFVIGSRPPGFNTFTLSTPTANALILNVVAGNATPTTAYWTGLASSTGSPSDPTNSWGYGSLLAVTKSNWSTTANGLSDPKQIPGSITDVIFTASNATGIAGVLTTKLEGNYAVNGVTFNVPASTAITSTVIDTGTSTLTLGAGGLTVAANSNSGATINGTGSVILSEDQSWANNSNTKALTIATPVSTSSLFTTLTLNGTGTGGLAIAGLANGSGTVSLISNQKGLVTLSGSNTYTGNTEINDGSFRLENLSTFPSAIAINSAAIHPLTFNQDTQNLVLPNTPITGIGGIVKTGPGSLTLANGLSTYAGGTTIDGGTLNINSNGGASSAGDVDPGNPSTVGAMTPTNVVTVNNGATLAINGTAPFGNSGLLPAFSPSLVVNAGGTVTGNGFVAFLPNVTLNGGTINVGAGNTTGGFNTNIGLVGTVNVGGSVPSSITTPVTGANSRVSLGAGSAGNNGVTFAVADVTGNADVDFTIDSVLRNAGSNTVPQVSPLVKSGPGTMLLSAVSTYTGSTTVSEGELILGAASLADAADVFIGASGKLNLAHGSPDTVNALTIDGVQMAAGTYGAGGIANSHITGTGSLVVTTGPLGGYDAWSAVIPNVADRGRTADPDGDGYTNIYEYLFGTSPIVSNGSLVQNTRSGNSLVVRWSQRNVGTFLLQESSTLADNPWPTSAVPVGNAADQTGLYSADYVRKEAIVPIDSSRRFVRVKGEE